MMYLIGGSPKCGKTTFAKKLSKKLSIPWVASDTLEVVAMNYVWKYAPDKFVGLYPRSEMKGKTNDETYSLFSPQQIVKSYLKQAKATAAAIDMFVACEIADGNDYILEGYHVTPQLAAQLSKKYGNKSVCVLFLYKSDVKQFVADVKKSSTPNDWILRKTKQEETFYKIAEMVSLYGKFFVTEAKKYNFPILNMDKNFSAQIKNGIEILSK